MAVCYIGKKNCEINSHDWPEGTIYAISDNQTCKYPLTYHGSMTAYDYKSDKYIYDAEICDEDEGCVANFACSSCAKFVAKEVSVFEDLEIQSEADIKKAQASLLAQLQKEKLQKISLIKSLQLKIKNLADKDSASSLINNIQKVDLSPIKTSLLDFQCAVRSEKCDNMNPCEQDYKYDQIYLTEPTHQCKYAVTYFKKNTAIDNETQNKIYDALRTSESPSAAFVCNKCADYIPLEVSSFSSLITQSDNAKINAWKTYYKKIFKRTENELIILEKEIKIL